MAWRLGAKTRVFALGAAVGLCLCPSTGFPVGMDPYCSSGAPRVLHCNLRTTQPSSPSSTASNSKPRSSLRIRVPRRCDAGLASRHHEASHGALGSARLQRGGKYEHHKKAWRHLFWTFEEAPMLEARCTREYLNANHTLR